jgi:signal transduction histidine kinase
LTLRLRLALWTALVIAGAICLLSAVTYALQLHDLSDEIDGSLRAQAGNLTNVYRVRAALSPRARERVIPQPSVFSSPSFHVQILDTSGQIVERTPGLGSRQLPVSPAALREAADGEEEVFETVTLEGQQVRVYTMALLTDDEFQGYVQVARSLEALNDSLAVLSRTLLSGGAVLLVISMIVAWLLAGITLRPIDRITQAAREIGRSGRLDRRLAPARTRDEVAQLAETFNHMMDRLESAFAGQRRFVADASHELRTPLTTIRGNLELLRRSGAVEDPVMGEALQDVIEESARMARLVDGLLALARADSGQVLRRSPVQLDQLIRAVYRDAQAMERGAAVTLGPLDQAQVTGDPDALKQLLLILMDNGLKYTPEGTVTVSLRVEGANALVSVRDNGVGISPEDLPHVFERFYRSPSARASGGTGLGLAIAHWIADEHGASIEVQSEPGQGSVFTVRLPAQRPSERSESIPHQAPKLITSS